MIRVDAIKAAYRQSKEGFVISFVLHHADDHKELAHAPIGSQWQLTLVELDENGNAPAPEVVDVKTTTHERRRFDKLPLPQQAALLCEDARFRAYLSEKHPLALCGTADDAAVILRKWCCIESRSQIKPGTMAGELFFRMRNDFTAWKLVAA